MVRSRIIKIHRALHETQTEKSDIEIEVPLRVARDRSDVMQSRNFAVHQVTMTILRLNNASTYRVKSDNGDARQHNRKDENDELRKFKWHFGLRWSNSMQGRNFFKQLHHQYEKVEIQTDHRNRSRRSSAMRPRAVSSSAQKQLARERVEK